MRSVLITGFVPHTAHLSRLLNDFSPDIRARWYGDTRLDLLRAATHASYADASITIGGPRPKTLLEHIANARGVPAIVQWSGSDVTAIAANRVALEQLRLKHYFHWASGEHLVEELAHLGIKSRFVPTATALNASAIAAMPAEFAVLTYLPEPRRDFYGQRSVWEAAQLLTDVKFMVVGRGGPERNAPPNVEYVGQVSDMQARIDSASVLLRITPHDSLSQGVIEALARGRHVVWTYAYPGVIQARSQSEAIEALSKLREAHRSGSLTLNEEGIRITRNVHDPHHIARGVTAALSDAIEIARRFKLVEKTASFPGS